MYCIHYIEYIKRAYYAHGVGAIIHMEYTHTYVYITRTHTVYTAIVCVDVCVCVNDDDTEHLPFGVVKMRLDD